MKTTTQIPSTLAVKTIQRFILLFASALLFASCDKESTNEAAKDLGKDISDLSKAFKDGFNGEKDGVKTRKVDADAISIQASSWMKQISQEIIDDAFPIKIGKAPVTNVKIDGVSPVGTAFRVNLTISYTNIVKDSNWLELVLNYDLAGNYAGYTVGRCNDQWAKPNKIIDALRVK